MKNILVPVDFSDTSENAAHYALQLAAQIKAPAIVLFHATQPPVFMDPIVPAVQILDPEELKKDSLEALEKFRMKLHAFCPAGCKIELHADQILLHQGVDDICRDKDCGLVVIGMTGGGYVDEKLIGSNALAVAKHSITPVIIVPPKAHFLRLDQLMLLSGLGKEDEHLPLGPIRQLVADTGARLMIFHMRESEGAEEKNADRLQMLEKQLHGLKPSYHLAPKGDFVMSVNKAVIDFQADLLLIMPRKQNLIEQLFHTSHTTRLAFHSHLPLMVINHPG
ncbi:MAG TPA: universal stress protein [Sediminibacterium sp.]|nr:universal stress protein [Sediminibacterium sp.]